MPPSFWSVSLAPGVPYPLRCEGTVRMTTASIAHNAQPGRTTLKVLMGDDDFVMCSLAPNGAETQALDILLDRADDVHLLVSGTNNIYVAGAFYAYPVFGPGHAVADLLAPPSYKYDLLGDDLPSEDDSDDEDCTLAFGNGHLQFWDQSDTSFLNGFELRHFELEEEPGIDTINLRKEEETREDKLLNDNVATALINSLLNSNNRTQIKKGRKLQKKLKTCKARK